MIVYFFLASNSRKSKSQAAAFAAFDAAQNNNEAAALRGVVWFETSWKNDWDVFFLEKPAEYLGGMMVTVRGVAGQLFIQTSQDR